MKRQNERMERPLPASDELFDEAANQISGRTLPVFKTGSVYCVSNIIREIFVEAHVQQVSTSMKET